MATPGVSAEPVASGASRASTLGGLVECMRPEQWVKNSCVLAPLLFSARLTDETSLIRALFAAAIFSLAASGVYLCNDAVDWKADLIHPLKRSRPVPSGRLSPRLAAVFGLAMLVGALTAAFLLNRMTGMLVSAYVVLNVLYSGWLKHASILDVMCIAIGFDLRVMTGAAAIQVDASHWLLVCTFLLALFLGIAKRRHEVVTLEQDMSKHRRVLTNYSVAWLDQATTLISGATVVAFALYTVSPETQAKFGTDRLIYTLPFVVYGILRYLQLIHQGSKTGNPTSAMLSDRHLLICIAGWAAACGAIIYMHRV
jgi:4-hydroxybenzoate polyprenyltransferase